MLQVTQEFIDALKEQDKVDFIKTIKPLKIADADQIKIDLLSLHTPVDLSALKEEVALIEGSHFKGVHKDLLSLEQFHPAATAEAGSYAYIKDGHNPEKLALLDAGVWKEYANSGSGGGGVPLTGAQIKALLFAESDTNNFDDAAKAALANAGGGGGGPAMKFNVATVADIPSVPYTEGDIGQIRNYNSTNKEAIALYTDNSNWVFFEQDRLASLGLAMVGNNLVSDQDIELKNVQVLNKDPNVVAQDKRLITVMNAFAIEVGLKQHIEQNFMPLLDKDNPTLKMHVSSTGLAGQMQVIDDETGHAVATMEWLKSTQEFTFTLFDKDTGVVKTTFEIKPDGKAYIQNKQVATLDDTASGAGGLFQFDYKLKLAAADPTPPVKFIGFDSTVMASVTKVYINKKDRTNTDMSLFIADIKKGDYFNIHDNNNVGQFAAFDVIGDAKQTGDIFEIPVAHYDDNGTLTDGERVYIHWKQEGELITIEQELGNLSPFVAGSSLADKLMELKVQVDKNSHTTSTTTTAPKSAGIVPVYSEGQFEYIDIANFIQDPSNPGQDISDGTSHYVTIEIETGKTLNSNSTWCWTKEQTPARMWTNAAKSQAVSPMELNAWISTGALIKIIKTGADWFVEDVYLPAVVPTVSSKALVTKGIITDVHDITEMGIYEGTDVANSPSQGHIIVEAFEDANGDLDLTMKDQTGRRTEGGMPSGGTATWHHVDADHLYGHADPLDADGHDGDLYFKLS